MDATALRESMLRDVAVAMRPRGPIEDGLRAELPALPAEDALRRPDAELLDEGMRPGCCHLNAVTHVGRTPGSAWVVGWWEQHDTWTLHSVVREGGRLVCVTPQPGVAMPATLRFAPDPAIAFDFDVVGRTVRFEMLRRGVSLADDTLVRKDPAALAAAAEDLAAALLSARDPMALRPAFEALFFPGAPARR